MVPLTSELATMEEIKNKIVVISVLNYIISMRKSFYLDYDIFFGAFQLHHKYKVQLGLIKRYAVDF